MQYGYFDDSAKEYVITRPDTPQSWSNYLGSTEYGAIITNNAGGYGFYQSGAKGRFLRLRFNSIPMDQPGRYFYLRDRESGDYWSASWQPVGKPLDQYQSTCRHGTAYTVIESDYAGIETETTYFVPLGQNFEYWRLKVTNRSDKPRRLSVFTFCEFTNQWDTLQDQVNLQYSLFIIKGELLADDLLRIAIQDNLSAQEDSVSLNDIAHHTWMALAGRRSPATTPAARLSSAPTAATTTRWRWNGALHQQPSPTATTPAAACRPTWTLQPGESREMLVMLGIGDARTVGRKTVAEFGSLRARRRGAAKTESTTGTPNSAA